MKQGNKRRVGKKMRLSWYIMILFFVSFCLYFFCLGFYDGIRYGNTAEGDISYQMEEYRDATGDDIVSLLLVLGMAAFFSVMVNRKISRPLKEVTKNMKKVADGELEARVEIPVSKEFQQIEDSFNAMAQALWQAEEERKRQNENNQQLYSAIAHDLKSPMTMILGYAQTLERGTVTDENKIQEYLKVISDQATHMNDLLDVLLTYTRLENRTYQMRFEEKDLTEVLRACIAQFYQAFEEHETELEIQIPESSCMYSMDEVELRRVFTNLLSNMIRHTEPGTVCKVTMEEHTLDKKGKECVRLSFEDWGSYLPDEVKEKLFEPFCVGDVSRNTKGGSGLGLSIAKKVIEQHEGNLYYEEYPENSGKAFIITL